MGIDVTAMNNYGCSLIWGHPQGPTGLRAIMELIEELVLKRRVVMACSTAARPVTPPWRWCCAVGPEHGRDSR